MGMFKNKNRKIIFLIWLLIFGCYSIDSESTIQNEIKALLKEQVDSWNEGDLNGFMAFYWKSEDFTFQSKNKRLEGWQQLYDMYQKNYAGEKMGELLFSDLDIHVLSKNSAHVLGRWTVTTADTSRQGLFTLIFKKFDEGWRIVVDHSS